MKKVDVPILTLCLPTLNTTARSNTLLASLYFILQELTNSLYISVIELVISDNSKYSRESFLEKEFPALTNGLINYKYSWNGGEIIGFSENIKKCLSIANAEYVWIIGDDDFLIQNSIDYIINKLVLSGVDLLMLKRVNFAIENNIGSEDLIIKINNYRSVHNLNKTSAIDSSFVKYDDLWSGVNNDNIYLGAIMLFVFRRKIWLSFDNLELQARKSNYWINDVYKIYPHIPILSGAFNNSKVAQLNLPVIVVGDGVREWSSGKYFSRLWKSKELFIHINIIPRILKIHLMNGMPLSKYNMYQKGLSYFVGFYLFPYLIHTRFLTSKNKRNDIDVIEALQQNRSYLNFYYGMIRGLISIYILNPFRRLFYNV